MKRFFLLLILLVSLMPISAKQEEVNQFKVNGLWYKIYYKDEVKVISSQDKVNYSGDIIIPDSVTFNKTKYRVMIIDAGAFKNCYDIKSITITPQEKWMHIYSGAFAHCHGTISVPSNVSIIESDAFLDTDMYNDKSNWEETDDYRAFYVNDCLIKVVIKSYKTDGIDFVVRKGTHLIADDACRYPVVSQFRSITIPEGVEYIGRNAFSACNPQDRYKLKDPLSKLKSVYLPNSVTVLRDSSFYGNGNLTEVFLPNYLETICRGTFQSCGIQSITFPPTIKKIGDSSFGNNRISSISLPYSVTEIGSYAFSYNTSFTSVVLPENMEILSSGVFSGCSELENVVIPKGVKRIHSYAFNECGKLKSIIIPASVTYMDDKVFEGCSSLKEIYFNGSKESIKMRPNAIPTTARVYYNSLKTPELPVVYDGQPPLLAFVDGSLMFKDGNGNNRIDADEKGTILFKIVNNGKGAAMNCEARVRMTGATKGIFVTTVKLPIIAVGKTQEVSIPVTSSVNTTDGQVSFAIEVYEPQGWGVAPVTMNVTTKAYNPPFLQVVDYNIASNSGKIRKMEPFTLTFNVQNTKYGNAENVQVKVKLPANVFVMDGNAELSYPLIKSGEVKSVKITLAANNNYPTTNIPITIDVKEKHGKFAENKQLDIALNQTTSSSINIAAKEEAEQERKEIQLAMMTSDVDRNIPVTRSKNSNTFVLILANEHYQQVATVPFALNDGNIFREYCIKTLGINEKHIKYLSNATGNQLKAGINWLANLTEAFDNPQIIVYYAGHGIPDESNRTAYLLPVDGIISDMSTCYKLDDLYTTLGSMPASHITVFMDACFSGSKREEGMLASARGIALKAKSGIPQGNMVVFSAAQGDETAYPNREQQHGLFTYYLLKKLQETQGEVSLKDLGDYVTKQVSQQSLLINSKKQTPCVTPSASLGTEWQNWKLK